MTNRPPPVQATSELVLEVPDLEAACPFYRDGRGLEETLYGEGLGPGRAIYAADPDGNVVELWSQSMADYTGEARAGGGAGTLPKPGGGRSASPCARAC